MSELNRNKKNNTQDDVSILYVLFVRFIYTKELKHIATKGKKKITIETCIASRCRWFDLNSLYHITLSRIVCPYYKLKKSEVHNVSILHYHEENGCVRKMQSNKRHITIIYPKANEMQHPKRRQITGEQAISRKSIGKRNEIVSITWLVILFPLGVAKLNHTIRSFTKKII